MILLKRVLLLTILIGLSACSSARVLAPTPNIFANGTYPQSEIPSAYQTARSEIFFITDRDATRHDGLLSYGNDRSSSMAFGASTVAFGESQDWQSLSTASGLVKRDEKIKLSITQNREILRFDKTPTPFDIVNGTPVRKPEAVASYNRKRSEFQAQIREQMRLAGKDEVVIFVPGFNKYL